MASNLRIVRLREIIEFNPKGELNYEKVKNGIREIAVVRGAFVDYDVLVDTRGTESHLTVADLWEIAKDLAIEVHASSPEGFTAKVAVICPAEAFDHARFFQLCAQNQGLNVQAFTSYEDMFHWLGESSPAL